MRIGITVHFQFSFFSSGSPQTALAVGEVLRIKGHDITFINCGTENTWWEDLKSIQKDWNVVQEKDAADFDLVIEIGGQLLKPEKRKKQKRCVWLFRKNPLFHDIEASLYPFTNGKRDLEGISEVWLFEDLVTGDDVQYIELLTGLPVRRLPFVWTATGVEIHRREQQAPVWLQVSSTPKPWSIHITETNTSSASSCTIPLFIMREVKKKSGIELNSVVKIHNAENVNKSSFFQDNVYSHAFDELENVKGEFIGRQRVIDFVYDCNSIVIAHSRFCLLRTYLLDLAWVGVPFVHNLHLLSKALGGIVQEGYYPDNEIVAGKEAFERVVAAAPKSTIESLIEMRKNILQRFSPLSERICNAWVAAAAGSSLPLQPLLTSGPLRVGFCDMWDAFNPEYNPFTLMLEAAYKDRKVVGLDITNHPIGNEECDVVIFGPFGKRWEAVRQGIPKVHFTGENTPPVQGANLNLGFSHRNGTGEEYLRLPLWMLEINWFRANVERLQNPKPIPIDRVCKVFADESERKKFCAFVVSNPCQPMRNAAFQWLNSYKPVDSAGRLFNNVGDKIFAGLGGGGGELKKLEFFKDYKYALTFENASADGYVTEKLLHAKAAGCIPIYWGDPKVERDFDVKGFIDARKITTRQELIDLVEEVEKDEDLWKSKLNVPALDEVGRDRVRRTLAECARRIWALAGLSEEEQKKIPKFIGYTCDRDGEAEAVKEGSEFQIENTVLVTAANTKFLPSLQIWLQTSAQQKQSNPGLQVRVYMMADVEESVLEEYKQSFPFAQIYRFPTDVPEGFPDFWAPEHYAWKIWIYQKLVQEEELKGKLIFYTDAGVLMCRWPHEWLQKSATNGICVLEDKEQTNDRWCHDTFKRELAMSQDECEANQIVAGIMSFVGGHPKAVQLFKDAWTLAQRRELIVGPKWAGVRGDGKPYGHRHDQSILSVLSLRGKVAKHPLEKEYCHTSLRQTFLKGASLYVHRGRFTVHTPFADSIDDVWVINLDRRADRLERFRKEHPGLVDRCLRLPAFDGLALTLTPKIARLFAPHDFKWKKAVMGCALSHLALWMKLLTDAPEIQSYLILEDDVRLKPEWRSRWDAMVNAKALPEDWDVVYLGGVLPPNREGFERMGVEKVNNHIARVKENTLFGQKEANRYFHFCAYAYVLSRRGAQKVVEFLKHRGGYWTSADHMMCNLVGLLNMYFLHPLVAGCYQDDDPKYCNSAFNDFSRKDEFDSDLWNNNEHFSKEEVEDVLKPDDQLDILGALVEARAGASAEPKKKADLSESLPNLSKRRLVQVAGPPLIAKNLYEFSWWKQILWDNAGINLEIHSITNLSELEKGEEPIVILQRPYVQEAERVLEGWRTAGRKFYLLHISDEFGQDSIEMYAWPEVLGVIRNYVRPDAPNSEKVRTIPLGFHWAIENGEPVIHTPRPPFRDLVWSFVGTGWAGRKEKLEVLKRIPGEQKCVFQEEWDSPNKVGREEMLQILLNSWFVPCPGGQNPETFRFYEALEAGAIPVLVKEPGTEAYLNFLVQWFPLLVADSWEHAAGLIHTLHEKPEVYEQYRIQILSGWEKCKRDVREWVRGMFRV